jgi:hypothetical protein
LNKIDVMYLTDKSNVLKWRLSSDANPNKKIEDGPVLDPFLLYINGFHENLKQKTPKKRITCRSRIRIPSLVAKIPDTAKTRSRPDLNSQQCASMFSYRK